MTKRERVKRAIAHQQPDKTPWDIGITSHARAQLAKYYGDPRLEEGPYFAAWAGNHMRHVTPRSKGQFHELEEEVAPGLWRDGWGIVWDTRGIYGEGEWGRPVNCVLPEPDLAQFTFPDPPGPQAYAHYAASIEANSEYYIIANEGHLFEVAWALRGMEGFLSDLVLHPQFVDALLAGITAYYMDVIEHSLEYDVDCFTFGDDWGSQRQGLMMGPRLWRRFFKPCLARMFDRIRSAGRSVALHSDGDVTAIMDDLIEIGLDVYNPFQPEIMDVYAIKRRYGDRLTFYGGVGIQQLLPFGTPEEVRSETHRLIREIGAGGGYILAPSHSILADAPPENVAALIETVQEQ
jgi:uroporphyrinogen decarboxylase